MAHYLIETMSEPFQIPPGPLSREAFYAWADAQPEGRFELEDGEVVAMAPERAAHAAVKGEVWLALRNAVRDAGLPCKAVIDSLAVEVGANTAYVPDVLVDCGDLGRDALVAPAPVIVVEVISPSTGRRDAVRKFADYFRVPSIRHYLIVDPDRRVVLHHRRRLAGDDILSRIVAGGMLTLDPPGITVRVEDFFA